MRAEGSEQREERRGQEAGSAGLSLTRVFSLSPSMTGWISVTAGERRRLDAERASSIEVTAKEIQVEIGTTFP